MWVGGWGRPRPPLGAARHAAAEAQGDAAGAEGERPRRAAAGRGGKRGLTSPTARRCAPQFYTARHGFHAPFKVILDGTVLHASLEAGQPDVEAALAKLLGNKVRVFVSKCIRAEVQGLGREYAGTLRASRSFPCHQCGHDAAETSAAQCIADVVGEANAQHFFVATNDRALRAKLDRVPEAPVVFRTVNGLQLQAPTGAQAAAAGREQRAVEMVELRRAAALQGEGGERGGGPRGDPTRRGPRKAKGPNPLAVKKKKKKGERGEGGREGGAPLRTRDENGAGEEGSAKKRKRQRRKSREGGGARGGDGAE